MDIPKSQQMSFWKKLVKKQHLTQAITRFLRNDINRKLLYSLEDFEVFTQPLNRGAKIAPLF